MAKRLSKTDNMKKAIFKFGQMTFDQGKYFLPPYTRSGCDPVSATAEEAEKIMKALSAERVVRIKGDVGYPFITTKRTPCIFDQKTIDSIWILLHYAYTHGEEKQPWDLVDDVIVESSGCVRFRYILNHRIIVNIIPIDSPSDIDQMIIEDKQYVADEYGKEDVRYLVITRNKKWLIAAGNAKVNFPIKYVLITGDETHEPTEIKYLKKANK